MEIVKDKPASKPNWYNYQNSPEGKLKRKNAHYLRNFGITLDEYNQMFADQEGCCGICGKHQTEINTTLAVDHVHGSDPIHIRGLLCGSCNTALGKLGDNKEVLLKALKYLEDTE